MNSSSKSVTETKTFTMSSISIPTFIRKEVRANLSMWPSLFPAMRPSNAVLMQGGRASMTTSDGRSSPVMLALFSLSTFASRFVLSLRGSGRLILAGTETKLKILLWISSLRSRIASGWVRRT